MLLSAHRHALARGPEGVGHKYVVKESGSGVPTEHAVELDALDRNLALEVQAPHLEDDGPSRATGSFRHVTRSTTAVITRQQKGRSGCVCVCVWVVCVLQRGIACHATYLPMCGACVKGHCQAPLV